MSLEMKLRQTLACLFLMWTSINVALAQPVAAFSSAGNMTTSRARHTATLLTNGKVLIAGGNRQPALGVAPEILASAELFDPSTESFVPIGNMRVARAGHTATLLFDGRVLLAGGSGTSAELYDPSIGTFTETGSMITAQDWHTATLLGNGKVLFAGGFTRWPGIAVPELYDPATGRFTQIPGYSSAGFACDWCAPATLLPNGKVLLARSQPAQLYDPRAGAFEPAGEMISTDRFTATALPNGRVLLTGGGLSGRSPTSEIYDPASRSFTSAAPMAYGRGWHSSTLLPDGTTLITGGETEECSGNFCYFAGSLDTAELYDASLGIFTSHPKMGARREGHTATLLPDGRALITGGVAYGGVGIFFGTLASAELYRPQVLIPAPTLLSVSGDGRGQGQILHSGTARLVSNSDPAVEGEAIEIYLTGLADDSAIPPQVTIGGQPAETLYFGKAPGFENLNQVNVRIPSGIRAEPAVPVRLIYLERPSNEVTLGIR